MTENAKGADVDGSYNTVIADGETTATGTLTVENGTAQFTLKHGQTITILGIPENTGYTVTVTVPTADGYTVNADIQRGTIGTGTLAANNATTVSFINTRKVGDLTVTKLTEGSGLESWLPEHARDL